MNEPIPQKNNSGFTLVEALVSLTVLTVGLVAGYAAAVSSAGLASSIRNNVIAANLAQEGVEVIRAIRDTNWFSGVEFDVGLAPGEYEVTYRSAPALSSYKDRYMYIKTGGVYQYNLVGVEDGQKTLFKRKVTISKPSDVELKVVTEVTWSFRGRDRSVSLESHLFNWALP